MRILRLITVFFFVIVAQTAVTQTASETEGCFPLLINFTAPAGQSSFFWDFKDGTSSTLENPGHTFSSAGVFDVEFKANSGGAVIGTVRITIHPKPDPLIAPLPADICELLELDFIDATVPVDGVDFTAYDWVFGDGNSASGASVAHTYQAPGTYTVSLGLSTAFASCDVTKQFDSFVDIAEAPVANFTTSPNPPVDCQGPLVISFIDNSTGNGLTYDWDFGNGNVSTVVAPPIQTYIDAGNYPVVLTVTNSDNCSNSFTQLVNIGQPTADFILPDTICADADVVIQNSSSAGNYIWQFGSGAIPPISSSTNPAVRFTEAGLRTITLSVTSPDGRCTNMVTHTTFVELADASFQSVPDYSCSEPRNTVYTPQATDIVSYSWEFEDGTTSTEAVPTKEVFNPDTTTYSINGRYTDTTTLTVINIHGCEASFFRVDTIHQPNALFMPDKNNGCAPLEVVFSDSSKSNETIVSWQYIYGDGATETFTNKGPHNHTFTTPGEYDVQLIITNAGGCSDTSYTFQIQVGEGITPDFTADQTNICPGGSVQFTDQTGNANIDEWHFETDNGRSFHCFEDPNPSFDFKTETGAMDVMLTVGYNGCYSSTTKPNFVTVAGPVAKLDYEVDCANPYDIQFRDSSIDATMLSWDFGDGGNSTQGEIAHTYAATGNYTVILTAEDAGSGCPATMDTATVFVREIQAAFELDTMLCKDQQYDLDASTSVDVREECWVGYDWYFTFTRPIETQEKITQQTFGSAGNHTVTLVATDVNGCKDTTDLDVRVYEVRPSYSADKTQICFPSDVNFTDMSTADTTIVSWEWQFGDGGTFTGQNPPTHSYTTSNEEPVRTLLTIEDALGCRGADFVPIIVSEPVFSITTDAGSAICTNSTIQFTANEQGGTGTGFNYTWDFGNGQNGTGQTASAFYPNGGDFTVTLDYADATGGCLGTTQVMVQVQEKPTANFTYDQEGQVIVCHPQNIRFTDLSTAGSGISSLNWDFGNGQSGQGDNPAASFSKGNFQIQLIASTSAGCTDTISKPITLVGPEGDFEMDKNIICNGDEITFVIKDTVDITSFSWDFGDGVVLDDVNPVTHQYLNQSGNQTIAKLILRGQGDLCSFSVEKPVNLLDVIADFRDTTRCFGPYPFDNLSQNSDIFFWDFGDGNTSTDANPTHSYASTGVYTVELQVSSSNLGCADTISQEIELLELPTPMALGDTVCQGRPGLLTVTNPANGSSYIWTPANLVTNNGAPNPTITPSATTDFQVTETDLNGCTGTDEVTALVVSEIVASDWDTVACAGDQLRLPIQKGDIYTFNWTPSTGLSCTDCSFPMVTVQENVQYALAVTDDFDCHNSNFNFTISTLPKELLVPNAFTPDGDGTNDEFKLVLAENALNFLEVKRFQIFDRWGEMVFETTDPMRGWDGRQNSKKLPSDVYIYMIEVTLGECTNNFFKGDVTLIR